MENKQIQQFSNREEKVNYSSEQTDQTLLINKKNRLNTFKILLLYGGLNKYVDKENKIISKKNELYTVKDDTIINNNPFIKKMNTKDNKFFYNTIQPNVLNCYSTINGRLITEIHEKQNSPQLQNRISSRQKQPKFMKQTNFSQTFNSNANNQQKQLKKQKKRIKKLQKIVLKRIINYQNIQPKIDLMKGQYMVPNYISEKSMSITNFLTRKMLEKLLESINEFKQSITKIQKLHENFNKLKIQNQRSFNMKIQETNKLIQILFHQLFQKIQNELTKINYYLDSDVFISSLAVTDEEQAINYNLQNYSFLSRQLIRLIQGFFIVYKVIEKQINEKQCHEFIKYIMKIRYNINLLTKQYQYCQSQNKHPEKNKELHRKPSSLEFIKSIIKNKELTQRKLNKKPLTIKKH